MGKLLNLIGQRFSRLIVIKKSENDKWGQSCWLCNCDCGQKVIVRNQSLKSGHTKSCGCFNIDQSIAANLTHGHTLNNRMSNTYNTWNHMIQRCTNPKNHQYLKYGGRGIMVCERWGKFENFLEDMGEPPTKGHSIDRIDNNGSYYKENCRWATQKEQNRNKRNNYLVTHNNETRCLAAWAEKTGIHRNTIEKRLSLGWSARRALTEPVRGKTK